MALLPHQLEPLDGPSIFEDVATLVRLIGATPPQAYIDFMCRHGRCGINGLATVQAIDSSVLEIFTFYGIAGRAESAIADSRTHRDYLSSGWIPFADDIADNRYVLDKRSGEVWFLDYRFGIAEKILVANSFAEFLKSIEVEKVEM